MSKLTEEILDLERMFWSRTHDPSFFEERFADDGIAVFEPAGFIEKPQAVNMSAKAKPFLDVQMKDVRVREITPDCVILAYHGQGRHEGDEKPYQGSIASTYVRRDGRWQLVLTAHQPWTPKASGG